MTVLQHYARMRPAQPRDLRGEGGVIGREIERLAAFDLFYGRCPAFPVERATVEGFLWQEAGGCLPGIERCPRGIAVDVDHRSRECGMHGRRAEFVGEGVELVDVPVGVVTSERE